MKIRLLVLTASLMALNLVLGKVAASLSLPVYLDTIGTILAAVMLPWRYAVLVGVGTSLLAGILIHPAFPFYAGNQFLIATMAYLGVRLGMFSAWWKAAIGGFFLAFAASLAAAPVTVVMFGGVTLSGTTAINAVLMAAGKSIWQSVLTGALLIESIDKVAASVVAWFVLQRLPPELIFRHAVAGRSAEEKQGS